MYRLFILFVCFALGFVENKSESIFDILEHENLQVGNSFTRSTYLLPSNFNDNGIGYSMLPFHFKYKLRKEYFKRNMHEYFDEMMINLDSLGRIEKIGMVKMQYYNYMELINGEPEVECSKVDYYGLQDTFHISKCKVRENCVTVVNAKSKNFMVIQGCSNQSLR